MYSLFRIVAPTRFALLFALACLVGCGAGAGARVSASADAPSGAGLSGDGDLFYGEFAEICGKSLLSVATDVGGPHQLVVPRGPASPLDKLRPHALLNTELTLRGRLLDEIVDDGCCGAYPVLWVESFEPRGPVQRCTTFGDGAHRKGGPCAYTERLPEDAFAPGDFVDGPRLPLLDQRRCKPCKGRCPKGRVLQTSCDGTRWCCPLLKKSRKRVARPR